MLLHQHESYSHRSADKACFYLLLDFLAHFDYHNSPCNVRSNKKKLGKLISQQNFFPHGAIAGKSLNCMTSCVLFPLTTHVPEDALLRNVLCLVKALTIMNKEKLSRDVTLIHFVHAKDVDVYRRQWMLLSQIL